jgi:hypothetical protein
VLNTHCGRRAHTYKEDFELFAGSEWRSDIIWRLKMSGGGGREKDISVIEITVFSLFLTHQALTALNSTAS